MTNICNNKSTIYSDSLSDVESFKNYLVETMENEGRTFDKFISNSKLNPKTLIYRGVFETDEDWMNIVYDDNVYSFEFTTFSLFSADIGFWKIIINKFNQDHNTNLKIVTVSEEPENEIYINSDEKMRFYPFAYFVKIEKTKDEKISFTKRFKSMNELTECLSKELGFNFSPKTRTVSQLYEEIKRAIKNIEVLRVAAYLFVK